ncbi:MAG: hypothetical protein QOE15_993, partial [Acidimicrobiaceae bacterium]|nr:hypothetical protein [Acidimicrobiaceae bacterium]
SRVLTGYDVLLPSVLVEAQAGRSATTTAAPCPLRDFARPRCCSVRRPQRRPPPPSLQPTGGHRDRRPGGQGAGRFAGGHHPRRPGSVAFRRSVTRGRPVRSDLDGRGHPGVPPSRPSGTAESAGSDGVVGLTGSPKGDRLGRRCCGRGRDCPGGDVGWWPSTAPLPRRLRPVLRRSVCSAAPALRVQLWAVARLRMLCQLLLQRMLRRRQLLLLRRLGATTAPAWPG